MREEGEVEEMRRELEEKKYRVSEAAARGEGMGRERKKVNGRE